MKIVVNNSNFIITKVSFMRTRISKTKSMASKLSFVILYMCMPLQVGLVAVLGRSPFEVPYGYPSCHFCLSSFATLDPNIWLAVLMQDLIKQHLLKPA